MPGYSLPFIDRDLGTLLFLIIAMVLALSSAPLIKRFSSHLGTDQIGNALGKFCEKHNFIKLDKEQKSIAQELILGGLFTGDNDLLNKSVVNGYAKEAGPMKFYLSVIKREFLLRPVRRKQLSSVDFQHDLSFFGEVDRPLPNAFFFHKRENPILSTFLGDELEIENGGEDFAAKFVVRSPNLTLKTVSIPTTIQEALVNSIEGYPLKKDSIDEVSKVFITKKGVSIIAPVTEGESALMALMELGMELTEASKAMIENDDVQ